MKPHPTQLKPISRLTTRVVDLDHMVATVDYLDGSPKWDAATLTFKVKIVTESKLVAFLNLLPMFDIEGMFVGDTIFLREGLKKWGLLSRVNDVVIRSMIMYMAFKRLYFKTWLGFYWKLAHLHYRKELADIIDRFVIYHASGRISESTC